MKITHRVPTIAPRSAITTPEYEAEVQRSTQALERRYRRAEQRLRSAEARRETVLRRQVREAQQRKYARELREAIALVELRRTELEALARMMQAAPASSVHRGDRSYRPVPPITGGLL
jgi:hypothetical protein